MTIQSMPACSFAASGAVRLCLTDEPSLRVAARLSLAAFLDWRSNGKAEPFRTGRGKAALL